MIKLFFVFLMLFTSVFADNQCSDGEYPRKAPFAGIIWLDDPSESSDCPSFPSDLKRGPNGFVVCTPVRDDRMRYQGYYCLTCSDSDEPLPDYNTSAFSVHSTFNSCDVGSGIKYDTFVFECSEFEGSMILSEKVSCCIKSYCLVPDKHSCPEHSAYSDLLGKCICQSPYYSDISSNDLVCRLPDCPPFYEEHAPPLPLFKQTDNVANCNFFPYSDGAILEYEGIICCYGQEGLDNNDTCGNNELEIDGECYLIPPSESVPEDNLTCPAGEYYSLIDHQCKPFYDNNTAGDAAGNAAGDATGDAAGDATGDTAGDATGDTAGGFSQDDSTGLVNDALKFDRIQSVVEGAFNSYVLLPLPVTVSGTCSSEFRRTFDIFGHTYVLDLNDYMSSLYDLLPILKAIILFISVYSAIVLVLAGKGD